MNDPQTTGRFVTFSSRNRFEGDSEAGSQQCPETVTDHWEDKNREYAGDSGAATRMLDTVGKII
jgi:hypothetical protein